MPPYVQEPLQERMFEDLNDAEKEEIQQSVLEMSEKIALVIPPLPLISHENEDEDLAPAQFLAHQPWTRWSGPHGSWSQIAQQLNNHNFQSFPQQYLQFQYGSRFPPGQFENRLGRQMHGPIIPTAYTAQFVPKEDISENDPDAASGELRRAKRELELGRLRQTLSVTDANEWWHNLDTSRSHGHWSSFMDHYAPALHVGTINRGTITAPGAGATKDRIFGYNPDFNRGDWHALKFKPRGQYHQFKNKHLDYLKHIPNGLAQGPVWSVYDRNIPGYRIRSGQRNYYNYYGTPYCYNR